MPETWSHAIVVGASSGIGEALARRLGQQGVRVALVARRSEELNRICEEINQRHGTRVALPYPADVRNWTDVPRLLDEIVGELGGLDLLLYSSGVMPPQGIDSYRTADDVEAIEVNLSGAVAWINATVEYMLPRRSGTIVGISSIAGERGRRGNPVYNATKAALNVYLESIQYRVGRRGISIVTVKPGFIRTPMMGSKVALPAAVSADRAARDILSAAAAGRRVVWVPWWWEWIAVLLRRAPAALLERLPV